MTNRQINCFAERCENRGVVNRFDQLEDGTLEAWYICDKHDMEEGKNE